MSDIRLFRYSSDDAHELTTGQASLERELHNLVETHMETFLGVRLLAHEYSTGQKHKGRIDSLGLDENNCPVIIEYKRYSNENVINQGLFYLDWLFDHKADFKLLAMEKLGTDTAAEIEWNGARVLCIANDFTRYDEYAVAQIGRNIELIRYKYFGDDLLLLEWINPVSSQPAKGAVSDSSTIAGQDAEVIYKEPSATAPSRQYKYATDILAGQSDAMRTLHTEITRFIISLGDDINVKQLKRYIALVNSKISSAWLLIRIHSGFGSS